MTRPRPNTDNPDNLTTEPWWRVGMLWLVVGGPLVVVVAGITTAVIAVRGADVLVVDKTTRADAQAPAVQARNHAATPGAASRP